MDYMLGDITGLNKLFQSETFKLHRLIPELTKVIKLYVSNLMDVTPDTDASSLDIDQPEMWYNWEKIYPGISATNTLLNMRPCQRGTFLTRCRDWYREAIKQIFMRVDLSDPVLLAMVSLDHQKVMARHPLSTKEHLACWQLSFPC